MKVTLDHYGTTLGQLFVFESTFSKNLIFPMDFNVFMKHWNRIGVTLGPPWGHFRSLRGDFGTLWGDFGPPWGNFGTLWGAFEVTLGALKAYEGDLGLP